MYLRFLASALLIFTLSGCAEPPYTNIDNTQLKELIAQGIPVFDVRRLDEWKQTGVIQGSQLLTFVDKGGRVKADFMPRFTQAINKDEPAGYCNLSYRQSQWHTGTSSDGTNGFYPRI